MKSPLKRTISAILVWLGWAEPSEGPMSPSHGWLLPTPVRLRALRADEIKPHLAPAEVGSRGRR